MTALIQFCFRALAVLSLKSLSLEKEFFLNGSQREREKFEGNRLVGWLVAKLHANQASFLLQSQNQSIKMIVG